VLDAIVVDERDNVATAIRDLVAGIAQTNTRQVHLTQRVPSGHKFALETIPDNGLIIKYGDPVGRAKGVIELGDVVHVDNVADILPSTRRTSGGTAVGDIVVHAQRTATWDISGLRSLTFNGYRRANGRAGVRNLVLVLSTVGCANAIAERIARETSTVAITHQHGCLQLGTDLALTEKQLMGAAQNPNVGAVLLVGLGCETMQAGRLLPSLKDKRTESITIQGAGGSRKALERGVAIATEMTQELERESRVPTPIQELIVGTKCGGSDAFSGLTANPACGVACDMLVDAGAGVLLSETPGLFGSEPHLTARMQTESDRTRLKEALDRVWDDSLSLGERLSEGELSPGNIKGGLTTLVEKSLGATTKAGTRTFQGFLDLADRVPGGGLWLMDTPGFDINTISGQAAGGAQIVLFTTGRGSPIGCAVAPVIKVSSNSAMFELMEEDMDVNAGAIVSEGKSIEEVGEEIFDMVLATANGVMPKSEQWGHQEFALARIGSTL